MTHWTSDQLLDKLYGISDAEPAAETHLKDCPDCSARWDRLTMQRSAVLQTPQVSDEFLAAQRRKIYSRMEEKPVWWHSLVSQKGFAASAAAVLLIVGGLAFFRTGTTPVAKPVAQQQEVSDSQFFAEMSRIEQSAMPQAVSPIKALFVEGKEEARN